MKLRNYTKEGITIIEVTNDVGLSIALSTLGASIYRVSFEGKILTRNALSLSDFKRPECYHGKTIGRNVNRIKGNRIILDDELYELNANEGINVLHGGTDGLSTKNFEYKVDSNLTYITVEFTYLSPDGESGFPGNLETSIKYVIYLKDARFDVVFEGKSDKNTTLALSNHSYFNLGEKLDDLQLTIDADNYLDVDDSLIATEIKPVNEVMDFRNGKKITKDIDDESLSEDRLKGYDHFYYFNKGDIDISKVILKSKDLSLKISTDFEGVQIYTSNHEVDYPLYPEGEQIRDSIAIEPSDSHLKLRYLRKGELYSRHIIYEIRKNYMDNVSIRENFRKTYFEEAEHIFSCGGRFEILGNHTDHNHGLCLAATCNLAITAGVNKNNVNTVTFTSKGYLPDFVDLNNLSPVDSEKGKSSALIRGVAAYLKNHGYEIGGFNGYSESTVFPGAGVSSSAAFELLIGHIFNSLYNEGKISKLELAKAGQYAENVYFGKASGLLDQIGVAWGNIAYIDFKDIANPKVEGVSFPFDDLHFVIINTGGSHAELSDLYSAIPQDMYNAAKKGGVNYLRETTFDKLPLDSLSDIERSRAQHFYDENVRVEKAVEAIKNKDQETFLRMINESCISSAKLLKNMTVGAQFEGSPLEACDLFMQITEGKGAIKINGGGFAGSVIAVVPTDLLPTVLDKMGHKYGQHNVIEVYVREKGPVEE